VVQECTDPESTRFGPLWFVNDDDSRIAEVSDEADARLIAEAPALLEALKALVKWGPEPTTEQELAFINQAEALIARVEGK
jgi:hypothetical protein